MVTESALPGEPQPAPGFDDRRSTIGIRTARYSLIVNRSGPDELYDLAIDPLQKHNAYRDRSYRSIRGALLGGVGRDAQLSRRSVPDRPPEPS